MLGNQLCVLRTRHNRDGWGSAPSVLSFFSFPALLNTLSVSGKQSCGDTVTGVRQAVERRGKTVVMVEDTHGAWGMTPSGFSFFSFLALVNTISVLGKQ